MEIEIWHRARWQLRTAFAKGFYKHGVLAGRAHRHPDDLRAESPVVTPR
jgi:hypothetical protein